MLKIFTKPYANANADASAQLKTTLTHKTHTPPNLTAARPSTFWLCAILAYSNSLMPNQASAQEQPTQAAATDTKTTPGTQTDEATTNVSETEKSAQEATPSTEAVTAKLGAGQQYRYDPLQQQTLIENELQATQQFSKSVWLSTDDSTFLALWHKDRSGNPQGAVLLLPDENTTPANQHKILNLQYYLSENGWSVLTLSMPEQRQPLPPNRPPPVKIEPANKEGNEQSNDTNNNEAKNAATPKAQTAENKKDPNIDESQVIHDDSAEDLSAGKIVAKTDPNTEGTTSETPEAPIMPPAPIEPEAAARIIAGIEFLQENKQYNNIVLADGVSAARIIRAMQSDEPSRNSAPMASIRGLILLNAEQTLMEEPEFKFLNGFEKTTIPVLDIIESASGRNDIDIALEEIKHRKSLAKSTKIPIYISRKIQPAPIGSHGEFRLTRIIRGFLYQHAQGMERKTQ